MMVFIKNICNLLNIVLLVVSIINVSFAANCANRESFGRDWEPVSRGLAAITLSSKSEAVSLSKFRDSKLILDTAIAFVQSNMSADTTLISWMCAWEFDWENSVLQPLREALARLQVLKDATVVTGHSEDFRDSAVLSNPSLQYMMPHMPPVRRAKANLKAAVNLLSLAKKSKKNSSIEPSFSEDCEDIHEQQEDLSSSEEVVSEDLGCSLSSGGGYSPTSSSSVDIDAEFIATNDALARLEADILSQLSGGVRTVIVTQTKILGKVKKPIMHVEDALARLKELRPELDEIMAVLSDAIVSMCAEFRRRMPALIMERAYLDGLLCLGDAVEDARTLLDITTAK